MRLAGWALTEKRTFTDRGQQDRLDAATIYSMLENEIVPLYFNKNYKGYSPEWIDRIKRSIAHIAPHFTMKRQLDDYIDCLYVPEADRAAEIKKDNYAKAREIVAWKENVASKWNQVEIVNVDIKENSVGNGAARISNPIEVSCVIDTKGLGDAIGVEVVKYRDHDGTSEFAGTEPLTIVKNEGNVYTYDLKTEP